MFICLRRAILLTSRCHRSFHGCLVSIEGVQSRIRASFGSSLYEQTFVYGPLLPCSQSLTVFFYFPGPIKNLIDTDIWILPKYPSIMATTSRLHLPLTYNSDDIRGPQILTFWKHHVNINWISHKLTITHSSSTLDLSITVSTGVDSADMVGACRMPIGLTKYSSVHHSPDANSQSALFNQGNLCNTHTSKNLGHNNQVHLAYEYVQKSYNDFQKQ